MFIGHWTCDLRFAGSNYSRLTVDTATLGKSLHLLPSSIICYRQLAEGYSIGLASNRPFGTDIFCKIATLGTPFSTTSVRNACTSAARAATLVRTRTGESSATELSLLPDRPHETVHLRRNTQLYSPFKAAQLVNESSPPIQCFIH